MEDYTKWLGFTPATVDTTTSTSGRKWASITPVQSVGKVQSYLIIPAFSLFADSTNLEYNRLCGQFNYMIGQNFTLTQKNLDALHAIDGAQLCVRYRVGTTVTRYTLSDLPNTTVLPIANSSPYNGELIKSNCVFELWAYPLGFNMNVRLLAPVSLLTSILSIPSPISESAGPSLTALGVAPFVSSGADLPWIMPKDLDANGTWLTN